MRDEEERDVVKSEQAGLAWELAVWAQTRKVRAWSPGPVASLLARHPTVSALLFMVLFAVLGLSTSQTWDQVIGVMLLCVLVFLVTLLKAVVLREVIRRHRVSETG